MIQSQNSDVEIIPGFCDENGVLSSFKDSVADAIASVRIYKVGILAFKAVVFVASEAMWKVQITPYAVVLVITCCRT
jgi:hypothetical protein